MVEKILIVDDEKEIADLIEVYLQNENKMCIRDRITGLAALFRDVKFGQAWRPAEDVVPDEESSDSGKTHTICTLGND